ncbi:Uma2 family endonuclease [Cryptosporangium phraense]|uniref:Uma2 family endonuclease n=1 Tax=Cryptosporangium phraense TaxID=2593070 RepID=UPI00197ABA3C|nr:Uma2 family endonuclease [Cryptosporangium phraense]
MSVSEWMAATAGDLEWVEVSDGKFVVKRLGGNPHHIVACELRNEFLRQWPESVAAAPGHWALRAFGEDHVSIARIPDVLVNGPAVRSTSIFAGTPDAVVEVWSPTNTLAEMNVKRREYRDAGAAVFLEAFLTDTFDVHLQWYVLDQGQWVLQAAAEGARELRVEGPRPFTVVPNSLLR